MERSKSQGNLRDFRIDSKATEKISAPTQNRQLSKNLPRPLTSKSAPSLPEQNIKARVFESAAIAAPRKNSEPSLVQNSLESKSDQKVSENKSWGLSDFSMPSADDVNLWGAWHEELSTQVNLAEEVAPRSIAQNESHRSKTNLNEAAADPSEALREDWKKLSSEAQGKMSWATELALAERQAERLGVVDYVGGLQKHELLRMRTHEFLLKIQAAVREQVELFNESRRSHAHMIQIYKINNTQDDFMLFRNGVKLVVSGAQSGRILFGFNQFMGQAFQGTALPTTEISALWGPFEQLVWMYKGERVIMEDMVRYFFSEFVRQSFR